MAKATKATEGYVYFMYAPEVRRIKIGFSVNFKARENELRLASPTELKTIKVLKGTLQLETALLAIFSKYRLHGEWFEADPSIFHFLRSLEDHTHYSPEMLVQK